MNKRERERERKRRTRRRRRRRRRKPSPSAATRRRQTGQPQSRGFVASLGGTTAWSISARQTARRLVSLLATYVPGQKPAQRRSYLLPYPKRRRSRAVAPYDHDQRRTVRGSWVGSRVGNRPSKGTSNTTTKEGRTKEAWSVCSSALWRRGIEKERGKKKKRRRKRREEKRGKDRFGGRLKQCGWSDNAGVTGLRIQRPETRLCGWTLTRSSNK